MTAMGQNPGGSKSVAQFQTSSDILSGISSTRELH